MKITPLKLFQKFDYNENGSLSKEEFEAGLNSLDRKTGLSKRQKQLLCQITDRNDNGCLDYKDFTEYLKEDI